MHTIVHVLRPVVGGMLRHWQILAGSSRQHGFRTLVISSQDNNLASLGAYAEKVFSLPLSASLPGRDDIRCLKLLRSYIWEIKPDLIHFHGFKTGCIGALATRKTPKSIYTVHNYHPASGRLLTRWLYPQAERFIANRVQAVICVSALQQQYLTDIPGYPDRKLTVIYNGIDPTRFDLESTSRQHLSDTIRAKLGITSAEQVILTLARLIPAKGLQTLFEAAERVNRQFPAAKFIIAGDGPDQAVLVSKAGELNQRAKSNLIQLVGMVEDPLPYYAAADIFVLPSWSEGLPLSLLEAQASRLAVIASAVGGIPEVVIPGETGLLVPPQDSTKLAAAISRLLADDNLRQQLAKKGQARTIEQFTEEEMITKTYELYRNVLT